MKYVRKTAGYTGTDYKTNREFAKGLNITPVLDKMQEYRRNRLQRINSMPRIRLPRIIKNTDQRTEEIRGEHYRGFWMCETGTGPQVAQLHIS